MAKITMKNSILKYSYTLYLVLCPKKRKEKALFLHYDIRTVVSPWRFWFVPPQKYQKSEKLFIQVILIYHMYYNCNALFLWWKTKETVQNVKSTSYQIIYNFNLYPCTITLKQSRRVLGALSQCWQWMSTSLERLELREM